MNNPWLPALIVGIVVLALCNMQQVVVSDGDTLHKVTVTGSSDLRFAPDQATISLAVESQGDTPQEVTYANKAVMRTVQASLRSAGVTEMETSGYSLREDRRWNPSTEQQERQGYTVTHMLSFTTDRVNDVGALIDAAIKAGANRVRNVRFELSEEALADARDRALTDATKLAKQKAQTLAHSLGLQKGRAITISESSPHYQPYRLERMAVDEATPIQPKDVPVEMSVTVTFVLI